MPIDRQRVLPPWLYHDERFTSLSRDVRQTYVGLRMYADDHGRESAHPGFIRNALYPLDWDVTPPTIEDHLLRLAEAEFIALYSAGGLNYFVVLDPLRVDRPKPSKFPAPPHREGFATPSRDVRESFAVVGREWESEGESAGEWEREPGEPGGEGDASRIPRDGLPPSPFCDKHRNRPTDNPCKACGNARLFAKDWTARQLASEQQPRTPRFEEVVTDA